MKRYIFIPLILLIIAFLTNEKTMIFFFPVALLIGLISDRKAFQIFLRWKFLAFLAILVFAIPLFIGKRESVFWGIPYSRDIFFMSVSMSLRSVIILSAIKIFTNHISIEQMSNALTRIRLKNFSQVFAIAMNQLPQIKKITVETYYEFKNEPKKTNIFSHIFNSFAHLIARILYFADKECKTDASEF